MALNIGDRVIERISIIDDEPNARSGYQYAVDDLEIESVDEEGPINDIENLFRKTQEFAQAAICDYHLRVHNYSRFNGAELVAYLYKKSFPALLCTKWEEASLDEIRPYRKYIPALIRPDELDPSTINRALEVIIGEFQGSQVASRRPWRTLVRVESVEETTPNNPFAYIIMPAWDPDKVIRLPLSTLPDNISEQLAEGKRLHVKTNIGAERHEDLYFEDWEPN